MDKPQSLSMKDYLVRKLAVNLRISEKVIDTVVSHQFNSANEALLTNDSVEISGFGKFFFNKKKANKRMEKLVNKAKFFEDLSNDSEISEQKKQKAKAVATNTLVEIEKLKPRI